MKLQEIDKKIPHASEPRMQNVEATKLKNNPNSYKKSAKKSFKRSCSKVKQQQDPNKIKSLCNLTSNFQRVYHPEIV